MFTTSFVYVLIVWLTDRLADWLTVVTDWLLTYTECRTADSSRSNPRQDPGKPRGCCCPVLGGSLGIEPQAACPDLCGSRSTSTRWSVWKYTSLPRRSLPVHFPELPEVHHIPLRVKHVGCLPELPEVHHIPLRVKHVGCIPELPEVHHKPRILTEIDVIVSLTFWSASNSIQI